MAEKKGYELGKRLRTRAERGGLRGGRPDKETEDGKTSGLAIHLKPYIQWLESRNLSLETIEHRRGDLDFFLTWARQRSLTEPAQVSLIMLESYQRHVSRYRKKDGKPLANRTQRKRLACVQDYFRWLVRHGYLQANPASELMLPRAESRLPEQALSIEQIDDLMASPDASDPLGIRDRAMLELLYATAIRRTELARLESADLNQEAATLRVRLGKGRKDRIVPVGARALHWCAKYLDEIRPRLEVSRNVPTLFLTGYGEGFHPNALGYLIGKHLRTAGIKKGGAHLLRHSCATHLLEGGADIRYIQKLLGHASLETTAIYTEMSVEALRRVYEACHPVEISWKRKNG